MSRADAQDIESMKERVIQASLDLASAYPWNDVHMSHIAAQSEYELLDVMAIFPEKMDILHAYERQIDHAVMDVMGDAFDGGDTPRDKIFDVLMERFDVLNDNRASVLSMLNAVTLDPKQMIVTAPWVPQSMIKMMALADVDANGIKGTMRVAGVSMAYLKTLRDWAGDNSADMAQTMASLDNALGYVEKIGWNN
jgi:ubiquinone biosynthesis protein COQ9